MKYILKIDGKIVKGFDGPATGQSGANSGWYTEISGQLGTIEYTNDVNNAYVIDGRINVYSTFERIYTRMREQDLKFKTLEFIHLGEIK